jgi:glutathione S-transferase
MPRYTALITLLAVLFYFYTGLRVPRARRKFGFTAPVMMTGNAEFDRIFRVHMNTLEWMPIFLPALWLFAWYIGDVVAAALGVLWIVARAWYMIGYTAAANKRAPGFAIQSAVCAVLVAGAFVGIIRSFVYGG